MSEILFNLMVQLQVNKIPTDMAKIAQKNEKTTAFGGINLVLDKFDALLREVIDRSLGIRSTSFGNKFSEIVRAFFPVYLCDSNANVCFKQVDTLRRFFELMENIHLKVSSFRSDCGSYSEDVVKMVMGHTE